MLILFLRYYFIVFFLFSHLIILIIIAIFIIWRLIVVRILPKKKKIVAFFFLQIKREGRDRNKIVWRYVSVTITYLHEHFISNNFCYFFFRRYLSKWFLSVVHFWERIKSLSVLHFFPNSSSYWTLYCLNYQFVYILDAFYWIREKWMKKICVPLLLRYLTNYS